MTTSYLLNQSYGHADIPAGWTPVQANDTYPWPQTVGLDVDHQAAVAACNAVGLNPTDENLRYYRPCTIEACECDEDQPGDWAIRWTPDQADQHPEAFPSADRLALAVQFDELPGLNVDDCDVAHGVHNDALAIAEGALDWCQRYERLIDDVRRMVTADEACHCRTTDLVRARIEQG